MVIRKIVDVQITACTDLNIRLKEHRYACKTQNTNNALFNHSFSNNLVIDWTGSELIYTCSNFKKRRIIESICIDKFPNFNSSDGNYKVDPLTAELVLRSVPTLSQ